METEETYYTGLITRYMCGEATPGEIAELEAWVKADPGNAAVFSGYQRTWKLMDHGRAESNIDLEKEWSILQAKLYGNNNIADHDASMDLSVGQEESVRRNTGMFTIFARVAAVFLLLAIPSFFLYRYLSSPAENMAIAGLELVETTLPDGTRVTLNRGAKLTYPSEFENGSRNVILEGEAWFEVAHDKSKPFIVAAGDARIRVVGTSFLVNSRPDDGAAEVILAGGSVRVYPASSPESAALLVPGDRALLAGDRQSVTVSRNADVNFLAWKTKRLVFNDMPLGEVAAVLVRVYHTGIRLSGNGLGDCRITATFEGQTLESVVNVLKATLDLQVRNSGDMIELSGQGCNQVR